MPFKVKFAPFSATTVRCMAEMFMEKMHVFGNLLQDEWQVFTTPETHFRKDNVIPIFWGAFRVDKIYDQTIL